MPQPSSEKGSEAAKGKGKAPTTSKGKAEATTSKDKAKDKGVEGAAKPSLWPIFRRAPASSTAKSVPPVSPSSSKADGLPSGSTSVKVERPVATALSNSLSTKVVTPVATSSSSTKVVTPVATSSSSIPPSPSISGFAPGTLLVRDDHSHVPVEKVKPGDKLMAPDGTPCTVLHTTNTSAPLITIRLVHPGAVSDARVERSALRVSPNHTLPLIRLRPKKSMAAFEGGQTFSDVRAGFEGIVGGSLGSTSSVVMGVDPEDGRTRSHECASFREALRRALKAVISAERTDRNKKMFLSAINGNGCIDDGKTFYRVRVPKTAPVSIPPGFAIFPFSDSCKAEPHPNYPLPPPFATKAEAYAAAVAFKRQMVEATGITFATLPARYQAVQHKQYFRIPIHCSINGLALCREYGRLWVQAEMSTWKGKTRDVEYWRKYYFDGNVGWDDDDDHEPDDDDDPWSVSGPSFDFAEAPVGVESRFVPSPMTAETLLNTVAGEHEIDRRELDRYRHVKAGPLSFPRQPVPVDPYFLGLWLGDGLRSCSAIANFHETEIVDFLDRYAAIWNLHLVYHGGLKWAIVKTSPLAALTRWRPELRDPASRGELPRPAVRISRHVRDRDRLAKGWSRFKSPDGRRWIWVPPPADHGHPQSPLPPSEPPSPPPERHSSPSAGLKHSRDPSPSPDRRLRQRLSSPSPSPKAEPSSPPVSRPGHGRFDVASSNTEEQKPKIHIPHAGTLSDPIPFSDSSELSAPSKPDRLPRLPSQQHAGTASAILPASASADPTPFIPADLSAKVESLIQTTFPDLANMDGRDEGPFIEDNEVDFPDVDLDEVLDGLEDSASDDDVVVGSEDDDDSSECEIDLRGPDGHLPRTGARNNYDVSRRTVARTRLQQRAGQYDDDDMDEMAEAMFVDEEAVTTPLTSASTANTPSPPTGRNGLTAALRGLGVMQIPGLKGPEADQKHIPLIYLSNTREIRLAVLAGLIDSDGSYDYGLNKFSIVQSRRWHARLINDIGKLLHSLGIPFTKVEYTQPEKHILNNPRPSPASEMTAFIFTANAEIPTLLARKRPEPRIQAEKRTYNTKTITFDPTSQPIHGIAVSGKNQFLREDFIILNGMGEQS